MEPRVQRRSSMSDQRTTGHPRGALRKQARRVICVRATVIAIFSCLLQSAHAQSNSLVIATNINLPKDLTVRSELIDSLNGFLGQKEKKAADNSYVLAGER